MRLLKKKKVYHLTNKNKLLAERHGEIKKLHNSVNFQNLIYHFKGPLKTKILKISLMLKLFLMI